MAEMYRVAVCDNDEDTAESITRSTREHFEMTDMNVTVCTFTDAASLYHAMKADRFDLLLLDIDMPVISGIEISKLLRSENNDICIIFVSNYERLVFDTFAVHPFGFVRKNCFQKDFPAYMEAFIKKMNQKRQTDFVFQSGKDTISLSAAEILYIESFRKNQLIHVRNRAEAVVVTLTMSQMEQQLLEHGFLRINHGCMVNYAHIRAFGVDTVKLKDGQVLSVSRRRMAEVRSRYFDLMKASGNIIF